MQIVILKYLSFSSSFNFAVISSNIADTLEFHVMNGIFCTACIYEI